VPDVFRVYAFDINTNTLICEVPAKGLTFDRILGDAGAIEFTLNLTDPDAAAQTKPLQAYFDNAPFALYVERDGQLVWGGWAKTNHYTHSTKELFPISGKEWLDYFTQRLVCADYSPASYPTGIDPAQLISLAITDCQNPAKGGPGASVGIGVRLQLPNGGSSSGLPAEIPTYTSQSFVSAVIADMTAGVTPGTGGVDVYTSVAWGPVVNGNRSPQTTVVISAPRAGRVAGQSGLIFELLNSVDFDWPNDFGTACTTLTESGGGSGLVAPTATVQAPDTPVGALGQPPRMDKVIQHSTVFDRNQLSRMAAGEVQQFSPPVATPTVTILTADRRNALGSWIPGDDARLRAPSFERFPGGLDQAWRIVRDEVTVPDEGPATVKLTFNPPPSF
jgi:hypothetical protein